MGLCKCPKRRVTNQFCFEHRVCVCENCMVTNHPICIVQSYLQWLQDSDYNPICMLCTKDLSNGDCIRLTCYHVFHWSCLDHYARQLPATTAPRGYTCPTCKSTIFPAPNLVSPVADVLKEKLAGVNWARAGLGLPLLSEDRELKLAPPTPDHQVVVVVNVGADEGVGGGGVFSRSGAGGDHSTINNNPNTNNNALINASSSSSNNNVRAIIDYDDDKYKRRPASELVRNWWRLSSTTSGGAKLRLASGSIYRKYCMLGIVVIFVLGALVVVMSTLGRRYTDDDPIFDLNNNPNIHIQHM